ncbi:MAG: hypothetical protein HC902_05910 [Calothrix sp. SM1_5_4]|nr:hypothetical protein [Calothrix sp. SM1_5_4]
MYNICDADWSSRFSQLASDVVTLALDTIALPQEVLKAAEILKVILNGIELQPNDYTLTSSGIVLSNARAEPVRAACASNTNRLSADTPGSSSPCQASSKYEMLRIDEDPQSRHPRRGPGHPLLTRDQNGS